MAVTRLVIDGYGQVELNNVAFQKDAKIEAKCTLASGALKENGSIVEIDKANGSLLAPTGAANALYGLLYTSEKNYNQFLPGLKNSVGATGAAGRVGILDLHDTFITNTLVYEATEFTTEAKFKAGIAATATTTLYATATSSTVAAGAWYVTATTTTAMFGPLAKVVKATTMPDGSYAAQLQIIKV